MAVARGAACKKAIFINSENIVLKDKLERAVKQFDGSYSVFIGTRSDNDLSSLCTGTGASYRDHDYIVWIDPESISKNEVFRNYTARQDYHVFDLLERREVVERAISIMEQDSSIGALSFPVDYLQASNWDQYECWADYFKLVERWMRVNDIDVGIDIDRPPVITADGCCVIRTKAIWDLEELRFKLYNTQFLAFAIAIICQKNGYLPQYMLTKRILINNSFGYETYTSWMPDVLKVKKEYYRQLTQYNKENQEYFEQTLQCLRDQLAQATQCHSGREAYFEQVQQSLQGQIAQQQETIAQLGAELEAARSRATLRGRLRRLFS